MVLRVGIIGSGNWGTVVGMLAAKNTMTNPMFEKEVKMWVYEEIINEKKLTEIINKENENVKYLAGIKLPTNLVADSNLEGIVKISDVLVFVMPHQFVERLLGSIKNVLKPGAIGVTFIKGFILDTKAKKINLVSQIIKDNLGISMSAIMGANIANQVAVGDLSEATLGYDLESSKDILMKLFDQPKFRVRAINDVNGVEICGSLKNIVAVATGIVDGLGLGGNTKACIMRLGFNEMIKFSSTYYEGVQRDTFFESCGFGDLITTCFGGRNNKVASEYTKRHIKNEKATWEQLEKEILNGQKLQGVLTAKEVFEVIKETKREADFPFFTLVKKIVDDECSPVEILNVQL